MHPQCSISHMSCSAAHRPSKRTTDPRTSPSQVDHIWRQLQASNLFATRHLVIVFTTGSTDVRLIARVRGPTLGRLRSLSVLVSLIQLSPSVRIVSDGCEPGHHWRSLYLRSPSLVFLSWSASAIRTLAAGPLSYHDFNADVPRRL